MSAISRLSMAELNAAALDRFIFMPVSRDMIVYLAQAARDVIQCDPNMMPPPARNNTPSPKAVRCDSAGLPSLEDFISKLVVSSNVQVSTLMSSLVYLGRLKSRLQPAAKGLRCTTHRIFLAALILAAKYLNDSSPKNKHWAAYSNLNCDGFGFGFSQTEVNLMEKQLLFLLDWQLRITEEDLHRELDPFLAPIRDDIQLKYARRMQRKEHLRRQREAEAWAATQYPTPPSSRASSATRQPSPPRDGVRMVYDNISTPPGLAYSSSGSSYASSTCSQQQSRSSTPISDPADDPYYNVYATDGSLQESPVEIVLEMPQPAAAAVRGNYYAKTERERYHLRQNAKQYLPYEISTEDLRELQEGSTKAKRVKTGRGVWGRMFGTSVPVR